MQRKGPFKVLERKGISDYRVDVNGKVRLFHANLLKKYKIRDNSDWAQRNELSSCVVIKNEESDCNEQLLNILPMKATESYHDVKVNESLTVEQTDSVIALLHEFQDDCINRPHRHQPSTVLSLNSFSSVEDVLN